MIRDGPAKKQTPRAELRCALAEVLFPLDIDTVLRIDRKKRLQAEKKRRIAAAPMNGGKMINESEEASR